MVKAVKLIKCNCGESKNYKLKRRICTNGVTQYVYQCCDCGRPATAPISHKSLTAKEKEASTPYDYESQKEKTKDFYNKKREERTKEGEERKEEYRRYLESKEWKARRLERLKIDNFICQWCWNDAEQVHHLTYDNIYNEPMSDLISVCRPCHEWIHREYISSSIMWPKCKPVTKG